mgnify:CR=1 FL=1
MPAPNQTGDVMSVYSVYLKIFADSAKMKQGGMTNGQSPHGAAQLTLSEGGRITDSTKKELIN